MSNLSELVRVVSPIVYLNTFGFFYFGDELGEPNVFL